MLPIYVLDCAASDREGMGEIHIPIEDGTQLNAQASLYVRGARDFDTFDVRLRRVDDFYLRPCRESQRL